MKKTKKHSMLKTVFKVICAIAAVVGTVFAGMAVLLRKSMKKLKNHEEENNLVQSVGIGSEEVSVGSDTDNAFLSCLAGKLKVTWAEAPTHDVNVDVNCYFGSVNIVVPSNMKLCCVVDIPNNKLKMNGRDAADASDADLAEVFGEDTEETKGGAPVLYLTGKVRFGTLSVTRYIG